LEHQELLKFLLLLAAAPGAMIEQVVVEVPVD
jgi:hypothetical protein